MKFHVYPNEDEVIVSLDPGSPLDGLTFLFKRKCASGVEAKLMADLIRRKADEHFSLMRSWNYEEGWRDAKAKAGRRSWHSECVNLMDEERHGTHRPIVGRRSRK